MAHDQGTPANNCGRCGQRDWCVCRVRPSWIGALTVVCQFCRARFFPGEKIDCCESGKIRFPPATPLPAAVLKMFPNNAHSDPAFVKLWRKHSRKFNTAFAFASTVMKRAVLNGHGPPVVIATGQVFRILWDGTDTAETRAHPAFAQIYYYTQELSSRLIQRKGLVCLDGVLADPKSLELLTLLESVMVKHPLAVKYMSNYVAHPSAPAAVITLEETRTPVADHAGAFDKHTTDPIAGLITDTSTQDAVGSAPRILITNRKQNNYLETVSAIKGGVDALQYPLLHWNKDWTEAGWNAFLKKDPSNLKSKRITCLAYYRHRIMVRTVPW